ncbi:hypothetical protein [Gorillibacterium timonense]|nr:hypothetical protein [Gorillibacterium timonense]
MSKLVVSVLLTVLLAGAVLVVIGSQLIPAAQSAGTHTRTQIGDAFQ